MARVSFADVKRVASALGWVVLFIVIAIGVTVGISLAVPGWGGQAWFVARTGVFEVIGFGLATVVVGRLMNKYSWPEMGWRSGGGRGLGVWLLAGTGLGVAMAALAIGLAVVLDGARVHFTGDWSVWPRIALPLALGLVLAALAEELGFRGYPLRRLADAIGVLPAILLIAGGFAVAHAWNDNISTLGLVNIFLAGLFLSFAFFSVGAMPLAWGAHFGWNAGLSILFDAPVSGYRFQVPVVEYTPGTRAWVDGGAFGPEGGIVATVALLAGIAFLLTHKNAFVEPEAAPPAEQVAA